MHNIYLPQTATVSDLMRPKSVAVIGASEDIAKFGGRIVHSLLNQGFNGALYPINPARSTVLGYKSYPSIADIGQPVDLAIMAIPREHIIQAVSDCGQAGVKGVIVVTSGFSEANEEGRNLEEAIVRCARQKGMRLIGPNCIGIISPENEFVLCPTPVLLERPALRGKIGLVSQSGAIMGTMVDRATSSNIGFSHCISVGNQADLDLCDFVDFLLDDAATEVICTYIEGIKRVDRFLATARRARQTGKPWLLMKAGRTTAGAAAAFSHTASMASDQAVLAGVCNQYGIVMMDDMEAMLIAAAGLARYRALSVQSVAVFSPSGGGCTFTADRLTDEQIMLSRFTEHTESVLGSFFSGAVHNPVDIGAANDGASMSHTEAIIRTGHDDDMVDMSLTVISAAPDITKFAAMACRATQDSSKPHLMVVLPGEAAEGARRLLRAQSVLFTDALDTSLRVIRAWRSWTNRLPADEPQRPAGLAPIPMPCGHQLDEEQVKKALTTYGIQVNKGIQIQGPGQAAAAAQELTAPFVLKIVSRDISHKTEAGGVVLGLVDAPSVVAATDTMLERIARTHPEADIQGFLVQEFVRGELELIMGLKWDRQFGINIMVGAGGILADLINDVAIAPCPVSPAAAQRMLSGLRISSLFDGIRGGEALDISAAVDMIVRLSWLGHDWRAGLRELDINPAMLMKRGGGCIAVDGRALLNVLE